MQQGLANPPGFSHEAPKAAGGRAAQPAPACRNAAWAPL